MSVLETKTSTPDSLEIQAANSRFFDDLDLANQLDAQLPQAYSLARDFYLRNADMFPDGPGVILQCGVNLKDQHAQLVRLEDNPQAIRTTLAFNRQINSAYPYNWQLSVVGSGGGRVVTGVLLAEQATLASQKRYDAQGRVCSRQIKRVGAEALGFIMHSIATSKFALEQIQKRRELRDKAEEDLQRFAVTGLLKYGKDLYEKERKKREDTVSKRRFIPTRIDAF